MLWLQCLLAIFLYLSGPCEAALPPVPNIEGHFTAHGRQIGAAQKKTLDELLGKIQEDSKVDLACIVMAEPLAATELDQMAQLIFNTWNIGRSWEGGGALLVVSHDGKECVMVQSEEPRPIPEAIGDLLIQTVQQGAASGQLAEGLLRAFERGRRFLRTGKYRPITTTPLKRDPHRALRYALGALAAVALAVISSSTRKDK